jgi:hypothetical protein
VNPFFEFGTFTVIVSEEETDEEGAACPEDEFAGCVCSGAACAWGVTGSPAGDSTIMYPAL